MNACKHVYEYVGAEVCPTCGRDTHEIDWAKQNELQRLWKLANPNAKYEGWWSI